MIDSIEVRIIHALEASTRQNSCGMLIAGLLHEVTIRSPGQPKAPNASGTAKLPGWIEV